MHDKPDQFILIIVVRTISCLVCHIAELSPTILVLYDDYESKWLINQDIFLYIWIGFIGNYILITSHVQINFDFTFYFLGKPWHYRLKGKMWNSKLGNYRQRAIKLPVSNFFCWKNGTHSILLFDLAVIQYYNFQRCSQTFSKITTWNLYKWLETEDVIIYTKMIMWIFLRWEGRLYHQCDYKKMWHGCVIGFNLYTHFESQCSFYKS